MTKIYVIWSIEHDAWWASNWHGYTRVLADAGRYDEDEANKILSGANYPPCGIFNECKIPLECVEETS